VGLFAVLTAGPPATAQVHLTDEVKPGDCFRCEIALAVDGKLKVERDGKREAIPLKARAAQAFVERAEAAGTLDFDLGRGAALADFNLDGLLDLVQVNLGERTKVWRNVGSGSASAPAQMGHWLAVRLSQPAPNRDAVGSWIEVRIGDVTLRREVTVGGGHIGGQLGWVHFGLGPAERADVRVQWPDGETGPWQPLAADSFTVVDRVAGPSAKASP
jgi:hypothetical protein